MILVILVVFIVLNYFLFKYYQNFNSLLKISDIPNPRKIHKSSTPLIGGSFLIINLCFLTLTNYLTNLNILNIYFENNSLISIFFGALSFYALGFFDDKGYAISPSLRLTLSTIILICLMYLDEELILKSLTISFIDSNNTIYLPNYINWFLSIFSFLVLINAFNMMDGINLLASSFFMFILLNFYILGFVNINFILLLPFFIFFFKYNYNGKIFFGSSGIMPVSYLVGYIFIKSYNQNILIYSDWVFAILLIPLLELMRLMFTRIRKKQNPFQADQNHLHHYIFFNFNYNTTLLILLIIYFLPSLVATLNISFNFIYLVVIGYFCLVARYNQKL